LCIQDDLGFLARVRLPYSGGPVTWLRVGSTPPTDL
jgi:hypothetical protein